MEFGLTLVNSVTNYLIKRMTKKQGIIDLKIIKKGFVFSFSLIIFVLVLFPSLKYYDNNIKAKQALRDSKNIQLAMRLLSIQYYGEERKLYEMNTIYGMAADTIEEIKYLAGVDGDITLLYWNDEDGVPGKFCFKTDSFLVVYEYKGLKKEPAWEIYQINLLKELGYK